MKIKILILLTCLVVMLASFSHGFNPPAYCLQSRDPGNCNQRLSRYYFDSLTYKCTPFSYTGCGGNQNHFRSLQECQSHCHRGVGPHPNAVLNPNPYASLARVPVSARYIGTAHPLHPHHFSAPVMPYSYPAVHALPMRTIYPMHDTSDAVCQLWSPHANHVHGLAQSLVTLHQAGNDVQVNGFLHGMTPGHYYGMHVHQYGDLRQNCHAAGPALNGFFSRYTGEVAYPSSAPYYSKGVPVYDGGALGAHGTLFSPHGGLIIYGPQSGGTVNHRLVNAHIKNLIGRSIVISDMGVADPRGGGFPWKDRELNRIACGVIGSLNPSYKKKKSK